MQWATRPIRIMWFSSKSNALIFFTILKNPSLNKVLRVGSEERDGRFPSLRFTELLAKFDCWY